MLFVKSDDLRPGMRLAKPIYNKSGVMLYERNSKLSSQGIVSIMNFGLIGVYILEAAEPVPPMTEDDIEVERFQAMSVFAIK
ncbi:MAG: phosphohydrolase, partial [Lachnospiraceae bacterium]|nr:phosphohydrolase [Lachnospiraceae bacterium]